MEIEILNKISDASINGYYDPSLGLVVVWFHNNTEGKSDLVAYLLPTMNWDLREVISEQSTLEVDREIIEIKQSPIEVFGKDSTFDQTVRKILNQTIEHSLKEGTESLELNNMKAILDNNSYNNIGD